MSATSLASATPESLVDRQLLARVQRFIDEARATCDPGPTTAEGRVGTMAAAADALAELSTAALTAVAQLHKRDRARVDALT
jgi:hypothetical protein